MSSKLQPVRGTHDILPDEFEKFAAVTSRARELATLYGFREMATPIFEQVDVFARSMGESSDVVSKEMFSFDTKGGEAVALRPEFTAGIARAFISNGMQQHLPLKLFSTGAVFRYERPQKGRQRQFHQVNFEWLGDDSWMADVELLLLAGRFLYYCVGGSGCTLHINTLGDKDSRERYRNALVSYLTPLTDKLSEDSKRRLLQNPLRILDSKDVADKEILKNAPIMTDYLSNESKDRLNKVIDNIKNSRVPFQNIKIDPNLVRGLDYYNDVVFEFVANVGELGAQNTVLAGGRYDGLIEQMGGKPTPAVGFAAGVERLILLLSNQWRHIKDTKIVVLPFEEVRKDYVLLFAEQLRTRLYDIVQEKKLKRTLSVETLWNGKLSKRLEKAEKQGATHVVLLPPEEAQEEKCIIKNMKDRNEQTISLNYLTDTEKVAKIFGII